MAIMSGGGSGSARVMAISQAAWGDIIQRARQQDAELIPGLDWLLHDKSFEKDRADLSRSLIAEFPGMPASYLRSALVSALSGADAASLGSLSEKGLMAADPEARALWIGLLFFTDVAKFQELTSTADDTLLRLVVWALRDLTQFRRSRESRIEVPSNKMSAAIKLAGSKFKKMEHPSGGWSGERNGWDASEFVEAMIERLSADSSPEAGEEFRLLLADEALNSYSSFLKHAAAQQWVRRVDDEFEQPSWRQVVEVLRNGAPANVQDLVALVMDYLDEIGRRIVGGNADVYKQFWNEDSHGKTVGPKIEESARDVLVELMRTALRPHGAIVEPEGHMANDKRADIVVMRSGMKVVVELKRDHHPDVWTAVLNQLERLYVRDPETCGFGVYGVFWYGSARKTTIPKHPSGKLEPTSAEEMQTLLEAQVPSHKRARLRVVVLDVSGQIEPVAPTA